jgi:hypothetical protein
VVAVTVVAAVVANLAVFLAGRAAGGTFEFSGAGTQMRVDAATVAGFTAVPLLVGLVVVALLGPRLPWVHPVALVVAPLLAVVTIGVMTLPADLDTTSTVALALCHLVLVPASVLGVLALRRRAGTRGAAVPEPVAA